MEDQKQTEKPAKQAPKAPMAEGIDTVRMCTSGLEIRLGSVASVELDKPGAKVPLPRGTRSHQMETVHLLRRGDVVAIGSALIEARADGTAVMRSGRRGFFVR